RHGVPTVTGGGPFEVAVAQGALPAYLDLCADIGVTRVEAGGGFTGMPLRPRGGSRMVPRRGVAMQVGLGQKHGGALRREGGGGLSEGGRRWRDAGARQLVIEGRESACGVGLFDEQGRLNGTLADRLAQAFGLETLMFEAPNKPSQFAFLDHFGAEVHL